MVQLPCSGPVYKGDIHPVCVNVCLLGTGIKTTHNNAIILVFPSDRDSLL